MSASTKRPEALQANDLVDLPVLSTPEILGNLFVLSS